MQSVSAGLQQIEQSFGRAQWGHLLVVLLKVRLAQLSQSLCLRVRQVLGESGLWQMEQLKEVSAWACCFFFNGLIALVEVVECFLGGCCEGLVVGVGGMSGCVILVRLACSGAVLKMVMGGRSSSSMMKEPIGGMDDGVHGWVLGVSVTDLLGCCGVECEVELEAVEEERAHLGQYPLKSRQRWHRCLRHSSHGCRVSVIWHDWHLGAVGLVGGGDLDGDEERLTRYKGSWFGLVLLRFLLLVLALRSGLAASFGVVV
jgi:hypothetical protein